MKRAVAVAASFVFASLASSGCGIIVTSGPNIPWGTPTGSGVSAAVAPKGSVDMSAALSVAALNAASGRTFTTSKTFNDSNSWGCG